MNCAHHRWLRFSDVKKITLIDTGRLTRLISELNHPSHQWPTLLLFVGRKVKQIALKEIFPYNNIKKSTSEDIITLRSETTSIHTDHPIFFAESDPFKPLIINSNPHVHCHNIMSVPLQWTKSVTNSLFDIIHARLLGLFVDVLCIFADDFKDFDSVVQRLKTWASPGEIAMPSKEVRPR